MSDGRPWYREPETFIAIAALVVSISAVAVGIYEASLQRAHDRAEVWPHLEIGTFVDGPGARIIVENGGVGPAVIKSIGVAVDGRAQQSWAGVFASLVGDKTKQFGHQTIADLAIRAGDKLVLTTLPTDAFHGDFWDSVKRVDVVVCYTDVFEDAWRLTANLGSKLKWERVKTCPPQAANADF